MAEFRKAMAQKPQALRSPVLRPVMRATSISSASSMTSTFPVATHQRLLLDSRHRQPQNKEALMELFDPHGGYRRLDSFTLSTIVYLSIA